MKKLSLERFEDRINMSGFGPEDGAVIVEPWTGTYDEVRIQAGKIVAAGEDTAAGSVAISQYSSTGDADLAFGVDGKSTPALGTGTENANGLVFQSDGKAVISYGRISGFNSLQHGVARVNANGSLDTSFGNGGWKIVDVRTTDQLGGDYGSVGIQANGKIVLAGSSSAWSPSSSPWGIVGRFNSNGALDSGKNAFGDIGRGKALGYTKLVSTAASGLGGFYDNLILPDDKIVVVGKLTPTDGTGGGFTVARYTANGALDTSFNGTGVGTYNLPGSIGASARSVARQADGKLVVAGSYQLADSIDLFVARLNIDGTLDTTFGSGTGFATWDIDGAASSTNETGRDVAIAADGKIIVAGSENMSSGLLVGPAHLVVLRFDSNGSPDTTFGAGGVKLIAAQAGDDLNGRSVAVAVNGDIIVAGSYFDGATGTSNPILARFYGDSGSLMAASSAAAADEVFGSPDANTLGAYLGGWMNEPAEIQTPWGKRKR